MSMTRYDADKWVEAIDIATAAERSLHRFGTSQDLEAERRADMRSVARCARALSLTLNKLAECITKHSDGVHCTAGVEAEVAALRFALGNFAFVVQQAARATGQVASPSAGAGVPRPIMLSKPEAGRGAPDLSPAGVPF